MEKSKAFQTAVAKLESDWRSTEKLDPLVSSPATGSVSQFFRSTSLNSEKVFEEPKELTPKAVEGVDDEEVTLIAQPDDDAVIV